MMIKAHPSAPMMTPRRMPLTGSSGSWSWFHLVVIGRPTPRARGAIRWRRDRRTQRHSRGQPRWRMDRSCRDLRGDVLDTDGESVGDCDRRLFAGVASGFDALDGACADAGAAGELFLAPEARESDLADFGACGLTSRF